MSKRIGNTGEFQPTFVKHWREAAGLSQDRLVERVRENIPTFSKSTLSRIENGKQAYTQPVLEALADALGRAPADLIMREPTNQLWSILDSLAEMPPDDQHKVAVIVEALKKAS